MMEPITHAGYQLLHDGTEELAFIEGNGIRIDVPLLHKTKAELRDKRASVRADMERDGLWKDWQKKFGRDMNLQADEQKRFIVYEVLKAPQKKFTKTGLASVDDSVLQGVNHPFVKKLGEWGRLNKALDTFLKGIEWELCGDRVHPNFWLDTVQTFRSSSSEPNFQNYPTRDQDIARLIRSLFIASDGGVLAENDFKGIEVGMSVCYHKDPNFEHYLRDPSTDMHRDIAAQCYMLEEFLGNWKWPSAKHIRYGAKNKFVFPEFYGAWYKQCAQDLWEWIGKANLLRPDGASLYQHLKEKGITGLGKCHPEQDPIEGTFEHHLKVIESDFWRNRFPGYDQWKRDWWNDYLSKGYFDLLSGFRVRGVYNKKQVCNYPIQGSAFHCLLWCLVQINRRLRKYRMKSMLVGQIHDSLLGDVQTRELRDYLCIAEEVVRDGLPRQFPWIKVPLEIEYELCAPGQPWFCKKEYMFKDGQYKHPSKDLWTRNTDAFLAMFSKN